jgi:hypothetical protein
MTDTDPNAAQPAANTPKPSPLSKLLLPVVASLTLGLAPMTPEPHLVGKLRWVAGGAHGMAPMDWADLAMHGAPWVWLLVSVVSVVRDLRSARG